MPGDGDLKLQPIVRRLREIGYDGWLSLELMNPTLWKMNSLQVAQIGMMALQRLLFADTAC
jgi:4-hydroxyphenylpyruvate dioxygenase